MWPIKLPFLLIIVRNIFLTFSTLCNPSSFFTRSVQHILSILLQHRISQLSRYFWSTFRNVHTKLGSKYSTLLFSFQLNTVCWWKEPSFCWMAIPDLISRVHLTSVVVTLPTELKYSTFFSYILSFVICHGNDCPEILSILVFSTFISIL